MESRIKEQRILLVLRSGGDFKFKDADLLATRIRQQNRCSDTDDCSWLRIMCFTDTIKKPVKLRPLELLPLPYPEWPGWWSKMNLFSPELEQYQPFLYLDLDTACVGSLIDLLPPKGKEDKFIILRDFHVPTRSGSAVMWIPKGSAKMKAVWDKWITDPAKNMKVFRGDQDVINATITPDLQWQMFADRQIYSFKPERRRWLTTLPNTASLICFHGFPRIRQAKEVPWVQKYITEGLPKHGKQIKTQPQISLPDVCSDKKRIDARSYQRPWFSLLCPTRERPDLALRFINSVYTTAKWPEKVETLLYVDNDDPKLEEYVRVGANTPAKIIIGASQGVGKAWNDLARASDGLYLMMANDDLVYETPGWDSIVLCKMAKYPDGVVFAYGDDGINHEKHCAFPIVNRVWLEELTEFVPERYLFFRHDTDMFETAKQTGLTDRIMYIPEVVFRHQHHSLDKTRDSTTERNRNNNQDKTDKEEYESVDAVKDRKRKAGRLRSRVVNADHYNGNYLRELVKGKRIVLVGPSPHLTKKGLGGLVDSYDVVCRVNELYPFRQDQDYGSRTNILFYGCNTNNYSNFEKAVQKAKKNKPEVLENLKLFVAGQYRKEPPNIFSQQQFIHLLKQEAPLTRLGMVGLPHWVFYHQWIGTHPNTGIIALCMLANEQPAELFLTGYSFYSQGTSPTDRHHKAYIKYGGDEKYNGIPVIKGHDQEPQKKWFLEHFLPCYQPMVTLDSYLCNVLEIDTSRINKVVSV